MGLLSIKNNTTIAVIDGGGTRGITAISSMRSIGKCMNLFDSFFSSSSSSNNK